MECCTATTSSPYFPCPSTKTQRLEYSRTFLDNLMINQVKCHPKLCSNNCLLGTICLRRSLLYSITAESDSKETEDPAYHIPSLKKSKKRRRNDSLPALQTQNVPWPPRRHLRWAPSAKIRFFLVKRTCGIVHMTNQILYMERDEV